MNEKLSNYIICSVNSLKINASKHFSVKFSQTKAGGDKNRCLCLHELSEISQSSRRMTSQKNTITFGVNFQ